jgi:hypothetical protein
MQDLLDRLQASLQHVHDADDIAAIVHLLHPPGTCRQVRCDLLPLLIDEPKRFRVDDP